MENTNAKAYKSLLHKGLIPSQKEELYEQMYAELDAIEEENKRLSWGFQDQEELVDYLYNLQLAFPREYFNKLKTTQLLPLHDWTYVLHVTYKTFDDMKCPICLVEYYEIVVPHMAFCGHIFCLPCILRHLLNSSLMLPRQHLPAVQRRSPEVPAEAHHLRN
jgi:hypothetical protein